MHGTSADGLLAQSQLRLLDALARPILLADAGGRRVYQTPALRQYLDQLTIDEYRRLHREIEHMVARLSIQLRPMGRAPCRFPVVLCREVSTASSNYQLRGVLLSPDLVGSEPGGILVELEQTGVRPVRLEDLRTRFRLTGREAEVACLVARGLSDRDVALRLCISLRTVEHHTGHVLQKLGVASRAAVAALLAMAGG